MRSLRRFDSRRMIESNFASSPAEFRGAEELGRTADRGERVPDLVRNRGREAAQGREAVVSPDALRQLVQLGEVLEVHNLPRAPRLRRW